MKLDKAGQDLGEILDLSKPLDDKDYKPSIKLGMEAIDAINQFRSGSDTRHFWKLPSETKH